MEPQGRLKRRVFVGTGLAVTVVAAWGLWSRTHVPDQVAKPRGPEPFVRVASPGGGVVDQVLKERAVLYDPTPLFFPTEWNYGQRPLPARLRRQPGQVFGSFEPKWTAYDPTQKHYGAEVMPVPEKPADVLVQGLEAPFAGFGQVDVPRPPLEMRTAFLQVSQFAESKPIVEKALTNILIPRTEFAPLEFLIVVGSAGMIGEPVLMSGSGWDEVDAFFRSYLVKNYRLGERLNPGRYRVVVGP